jgi:casein kinase 1
VERIEYLHSVRYIHKDIKPENILIGVGKNCSSLYIIDFGLSRKYVNKNGSHIEFQDNLPFVGTDMFSSISALRGKEQSRRDDLESVLYMSLYFLLGGLPWSSASGERNYAKISCMKEEFIKSKNVTIPSIYFDLFAYVRGLAFNEKPSYAHMIQVLKSKLTTTSPEFVFYVEQTKPLTEQKQQEGKKERAHK